ncbi:hypothetical protein YC2023_117935 [Brassica napus]
MSKLVMDVLGSIFKVYSDRYNTLNLQDSAARDGENVTESSQDCKDMEDDNIDDPFLKFMVAKRTTSEVVNELDKYLKDELCLTPDMVEALVLTQDWLRASLRSEAIKTLENLEEENQFMDSEFHPQSQNESELHPSLLA